MLNIMDKFIIMNIFNSIFHSIWSNWLYQLVTDEVVPIEIILLIIG
jgi:hypothetical protein